jgi:acyl-CoA thioesterase FadM
VGLRLEQLGNKSLTLAFVIEDVQTRSAIASGKSIMVAYDNQREQSILIPPDWREKIKQFDLKE